MDQVGRAATVILYRHHQEGHTVFMTQRPVHTQSFPGYWVFPGGKEHPEDEVIATSVRQDPDLDLVVEQQQFQKAMSHDFIALMGRLPSLETRPPFKRLEWKTLMVTALRELWEETGIAYTCPQLTPGDRLAIQQALLEGRSLLHLMDRYHFELEADKLTAIGRITTPDLGAKIRRFDTAFFMVPAPDQEFLINAAEIQATRWLTPKKALEQDQSTLAIPTRYILMELENTRWGEFVS